MSTLLLLREFAVDLPQSTEAHDHGGADEVLDAGALLYYGLYRGYGFRDNGDRCGGSLDNLFRHGGFLKACLWV
jgi:hypothetical protein